MFVYAGIDEAGYGPMFGPLVVGCSVFGVSQPRSSHDDDDAEIDAEIDAEPARTAPTPDLWRRLSAAVCRDIKGTRRGKLAVNDSKKLKTSSGNGLRHLELGVLCFASLSGEMPPTVGAWLDSIGETSHRDLEAMPWYEATHDRPWQKLPTSVTEGEVAIARSMLAVAARAGGVELLDLDAAVVFEDRFNRMVAATRSKAATSFTFVAGHLQSIWDRHGESGPWVVVDRQSGRTRYRALLAELFPEALLTILREDDTSSVYRLEQDRDGRRMTISFEVDAEPRHLPTALASMASKYTRELMMHRFQSWFTARAPDVRPTAGYALDARRFWQAIRPHLPALDIEPDRLRRIS